MITSSSRSLGRIITCFTLTFFGALLVLAATQAIPARASLENILRVGPTSTPPVIDGELADACWQQSTMVSGFITNHGEWPRDQTTGYITYDDTSIYIAFRCNKTAVEPITSRTTTNDDERIFGERSVEIFLDTDHDRTAYYQFGIAPTGVRYEAYIKPDDGVRDETWNPKWELKTRSHSQYWTAEMRIPFASLATSFPQAGDIWGINLNRNYYEEGLSENSSWAMILGGFNRPHQFGKLRFGSVPDVSYSILEMTGSGLQIKLRNGTDSPLVIETEWASSDLLAEPISQVATTRLEPKTERLVRLVCDVRSRKLNAVPLTHKGPEMALVIGNHESGERYDARAAWAYSASFSFGPLPSALMDRYYYLPADRYALVSLTGKLENAAYFEVEIRRETDGSVLAEKRIIIRDPKEPVTASFDIGRWEIGRYLMTAHLLDKGGARLHSVCRVFFKRTMAPAKLPSPTPEISIRSDGIILVDKQPFCPFFAGDPTSPLSEDTFNVRFGPLGLVSRPLERLSAGLPRLTRVDGPLIMLLPEEGEFREHLRGVVTAQASNSLLLYWFLSYEAEYPMYRDGKPKVRLNNADELERISEFIRSVNPNHLTALQISQGHWERYKDSADIIELACPGSSYMRQLIPEIMHEVKEVRRDLGPGKPFILWLGASLPYPRTAEEIRAASYLALMHGAAGIVFHMGHGGISNELTRHWSVYNGVSREIEQLFPILTARKLTDKLKISVQPSAAIACSVREFENRTYLIAVNTSDSYVDASFSVVEPSVVVKSIDTLFENRKIIPKGNRFTDGFTSFEPHVYELVR